MSEEEQQQYRPEVRGLVQSYESMLDLIDETTGLKTKLTSAEERAKLNERRAELAERENDEIRRQMAAMKNERDWYFRAYTALDAQLKGVAQALLTAIQSAKDQVAAVGRVANEQHQPKVDRRGHAPEPIPPPHRPSDPSRAAFVNFKSLAESIGIEGVRE